MSTPPNAPLAKPGIVVWLLYYNLLNIFLSLTKITEFHDFGTKFELDRIFSFFFILEISARHPPLQNRVFSRYLKNVHFVPNCHI